MSAVHTIDLVPLRRTPAEGWVAADCWLDEGIERIVLACVCGWQGRDLTAADLGVAPAGFAGDITDEAAFARVSAEIEARHADGIVPAVRDLTAPMEAGLLVRG